MEPALEKMIFTVKAQANLLNSRTNAFLTLAGLLQEYQTLLAQTLGTVEALKVELSKYEPNLVADGGAVRAKARQTAVKNPNRPDSPGGPDQPPVNSPKVEGNPG